eukprot:6066297-Pyramimonas_sp.AAC.1
MEIGQRCRGPAIGGMPTPAMDRPRADAGLASSGSTWRPNPFPAFRFPEPLESDRAADQSIVARSPSMRSSSPVRSVEAPGSPGPEAASMQDSGSETPRH